VPNSIRIRWDGKGDRHNVDFFKLWLSSIFWYEIWVTDQGGQKRLSDFFFESWENSGVFRMEFRKISDARGFFKSIWMDLQIWKFMKNLLHLRSILNFPFFDLVKQFSRNPDGFWILENFQFRLGYFQLF
jgi:hypothetical protein